MKKIILTLLLLSVLKGVFAQFYVGPGAPFTIPAGQTLYLSDVLVDVGGTINNYGTLHISGDLECDGTIGAMKNLIFDGTSPQHYIGQPMTLGTLTINNTAGVTLGAAVTVGTGTTFSAGLLATSATSPLIYASGALTGTPTDGSHVNGPVQYNGAGVFTFPVGDGVHYRPVTVSLFSNATGMTATYFPSGAPAGTLTGLLQRISGYEYWTLTPGSTASGVVTLNWDAIKVGAGILNATGVAAVRVAHLSGGNWINEGGLGIGTTTAGTVISGVISTWGSFALGSIDAITAPLPLTFLGIEASLLPDGSRRINWQVATEQQLKDYTIERSLDGQQFVSAGTVVATGAAAYTYTDVQAVAAKKLYYRVRGNDLDGNVTYSRIVTVQPGTAGGGISLMPNPVKDQLTVSFGAGMDGHYTMDLLSVDGRRVYHTDLQVSGIQNFTIARPANIARGMYVARLRDNNGNVYTYKLMFD